jgi:hypothetical protein
MLFVLAISQRLGHSMVVAIGAAQVAAEHAKSQGAAAGQDMKDGVGFDRSHVPSGDVIGRHQQGSRVIAPHSAGAPRATRDDAAVCTSRASHQLPLEPLVQQARGGKRRLIQLAAELTGQYG